jgi:hypothetical protein
MSSTENASYNDIHEGRPRITSFENNGVRTTTTTTRLGQDLTDKPKETVTVRTIQHPDSTETVTVTEKKLPPIRYTETITREKLPKKVTSPNVQISRPATDVLRSIKIPPTIPDDYETTEMSSPSKPVSSNSITTHFIYYNLV